MAVTLPGVTARGHCIYKLVAEPRFPGFAALVCCGIFLFLLVVQSIHFAVQDLQTLATFKNNRAKLYIKLDTNKLLSCV